MKLLEPTAISGSKDVAISDKFYQRVSYQILVTKIYTTEAEYFTD